MEPARLAFKVFIDALRKGLPMEYKVVGRDAILARNEKGYGLLYASIIRGDDGVYLVASADKYTVWSIRIARLEGDSIVEEYLSAVPAVLSQHQHLFSTYEVDVWSRRLSLLGKLEPARDWPAVLAPYLMLGARIMFLPDTEDYAVVKNDLIIAWYNRVTGRLDEAYWYQARMGLL